MAAHKHIRNKPWKELGKNNPYRELTSMKNERVFVDTLYYLLDTKLSKILDKDLLKHKNILIDALVVSNLTERVSNKPLTYDEYLSDLAGEIELVIHGKVNSIRLAKKIINLQLKRGYYLLHGNRLLLSKKGKRRRDYLLPFLDIAMD